jgi:hypothetical protein
MTQSAEQPTGTEQIYDGLLKGVTTDCVASRFQNLRRYQDKVIGNVDVHWHAPVNEQRIVLIDQNFVFSVRTRRRIFERTTIVMSIAIHLWVDIYVDLDSCKVWLEVCADWPGTSLVGRRCETI